MTSQQTISLASGVLPDFPAEDIVRAASEAGYDAVGLMIDENWSDITSRNVLRLLAERNLPVLDVEVIWIQPGIEKNPAHERIISIGEELGAQNVLIVSSEPDLDATKRAFEHLCIKAEKANMRAMLEFLMITDVQSLHTAEEIVCSVGHPAGGILIDALHLDRCGSVPGDLAAVNASYFPYMQLCDAPAQPVSKDYQGYLADAVDGRSAPGEGDLPLHDLLEQLPPSIPLSMEVRSSWYRETYPDAVERAGAILEKTRAFLDHKR